MYCEYWADVVRVHCARNIWLLGNFWSVTAAWKRAGKLHVWAFGGAVWCGQVVVVEWMYRQAGVLVMDLKSGGVLGGDVNGLSGLGC